MENKLSIEDRIAAMARAINKQTHDLARATARKINNVWICEDGEIKPIENPEMLQVRVEDNKKKLCDMLRALDVLVGERDGHGD